MNHLQIAPAPDLTGSFITSAAIFFCQNLSGLFFSITLVPIFSSSNALLRGRVFFTLSPATSYYAALENHMISSRFRSA